MAKISKSHRQKNIKPPLNKKGGYREDLNLYVRSSWEANILRILKLHKIPFIYEPFRIIFEKELLSYTPDIYTPFGIIEIKGWMNERSTKQIQLFQKYYSDIPFFIVEKKEYQQFQKEYSNIIEEWEKKWVY